MKPSALLLAALTAAFLGVGCDVQSETEDQLQQRVPPAQPGQQMTMQPDTTAQAVWSFLQEADYRQSWDFWPDREPYYQGTEPHGALLNTYLNATASAALSEGAGPMPSGAMVVKQNHAPDSTLAATTVMYKFEGYAPDAGDWFWAKYGPEGAVQAAGHVDSCLQCHDEAAEGYDYLMTAMKDAP